MGELYSMADRIVKKVAVGIPLKGHTPPKSYNDRMMMAFTMGIRETEMRMRNDPVCYEFNWFFVGEIFVPYAREQLAKMALQYNCEYLFMIDDDMLSPFDLVFDLLKHDVDIVAPLAFTRNPPYHPVVYRLKQGWDKSEKARYYANQWVLNYPRNTLVECDAVGFGAVLIKTELFKKLPEPWFMSSASAGEDVLFCIKAREAGYRVFCDTSQKLGHLSDSLVITEEYSDQFNKMNEQEREARYGKYQTFPSLEVAR
jgi:hypothetical protein